MVGGGKPDVEPFPDGPGPRGIVPEGDRGSGRGSEQGADPERQGLHRVTFVVDGGVVVVVGHPDPVAVAQIKHQGAGAQLNTQLGARGDLAVDAGIFTAEGIVAHLTAQVGLEGAPREK